MFRPHEVLICIDILVIHGLSCSTEAQRKEKEKKMCVERCSLNKLLSGHAKKAKDVRGFLKPRSIYSFCHFLWVV